MFNSIEEIEAHQWLHTKEDEPAFAAMKEFIRYTSISAEEAKRAFSHMSKQRGDDRWIRPEDIPDLYLVRWMTIITS